MLRNFLQMIGKHGRQKIWVVIVLLATNRDVRQHHGKVLNDKLLFLHVFDCCSLVPLEPYDCHNEHDHYECVQRNNRDRDSLPRVCVISAHLQVAGLALSDRINLRWPVENIASLPILDLTLADRRKHFLIVNEHRANLLADAGLLKSVLDMSCLLRVVPLHGAHRAPINSPHGLFESGSGTGLVLVGQAKVLDACDVLAILALESNVGCLVA